MPQANRIPLGFLDLIGGETGGKNPSEYSNEVRPTVDLSEFYRGQTLTAYNTTLLHTAVGNQIGVNVPNDESWFVRAVSVQTTAAAATDFEQWRFRVQNMPREVPEGSALAPFPSIFTTPILTVSAIGAVMEGSFYLGTPLHCTPGVLLVANLVQRDAGPGRTARIQWLINRFT